MKVTPIFSVFISVLLSGDLSKNIRMGPERVREEVSRGSYMVGLGTKTV